MKRWFYLMVAVVDGVALMAAADGASWLLNQSSDLAVLAGLVVFTTSVFLQFPIVRFIKKGFCR